MAMDYLKLYDIIYALAARDGREAALFGDCASAAREAFSRSLAGAEFPELWFELPLTGDPWLDFHALTSYKAVAGTEASFSGQGGAYADALAWFAGQEPHKVRQLALSYDTSVGDVDHPAVQLLMDREGLAVTLEFLEAAGRSDAKDSFRTFASGIPREWYACYVGAFPGRDEIDSSPWVRVECIVGGEDQQAYARDAGALREHLAQVGIAEIDDEAIGCMQVLARSPFPLELQFNVNPSGMALPVVSASVRFQPKDWTDDAQRAEIGRLVAWMQGRGLADGRCKQVVETTFSKRVAHDGESALLSCFPAFVKLRWRKGESIDAKAYLMAGAC